MPYNSSRQVVLVSKVFQIISHNSFYPLYSVVPNKLIEKLKLEAKAAPAKPPITKQRSRRGSGDSIDVPDAIKEVIKNTLPGIWDCRVPFQLLLRMLPELDFEVSDMYSLSPAHANHTDQNIRDYLHSTESDARPHSLLHLGNKQLW